MRLTWCIARFGGALVAMAIAGAPTKDATAQGPTAEQPDNYTWLEDIHGAKSMEWVKAEDARTAAVLEADGHFAPLEEQALGVLDSPDKLAHPEFRGKLVYNTWRDKDHTRGIVRRTTLESYLTDDPKWETVIDYDALGKQDKQSWVGSGLDCMDPDEERCMVELSAGGEDAVTMREFDLQTGKFVEGGFVMPRGKQNVAWLDKDTLLIARDWGPGTMSESGYPITVKKWKRGTPLESAVEVYRSSTRDVGDSPYVLVDGQGHRAAVIERNVTTFENERYLLLPSGPSKLNLPLKSESRRP
jgi:prolyl oligopeptidase